MTAPDDKQDNKQSIQQQLFVLERHLQDQLSAISLDLAVLRREVMSANEARKIQATEYERRLAELNHSHTLQAERNSDYVSRDKFDLQMREQEKALEQRSQVVDTRIQESRKQVDLLFKEAEKSAELRAASMNEWRQAVDRRYWISVGAGAGAGLAGGGIVAWLTKLFGG